MYLLMVITASAEDNSLLLRSSLLQARATFEPPSENSITADLGTFSLTSYSGIWLILQLALLSILPVRLRFEPKAAFKYCNHDDLIISQLIFTLWLEKGFLFAMRLTVKQTLCGAWLFFLFLTQTRSYHFGEALVHGRGSYVATGRGYTLEPGKFVDLYKQYAQVWIDMGLLAHFLTSDQSPFLQSHFYFGFEALIIVILFLLLTVSTFGGLSVALYITSLLYSAMLFNPQEIGLSHSCVYPQHIFDVVQSTPIRRLSPLATSRTLSLSSRHGCIPLAKGTRGLTGTPPASLWLATAHFHRRLASKSCLPTYQ